MLNICFDYKTSEQANEKMQDFFIENKNLEELKSIHAKERNITTKSDLFSYRLKFITIPVDSAVRLEIQISLSSLKTFFNIMFVYGIMGFFNGLSNKQDNV